MTEWSGRDQTAPPFSSTPGIRAPRWGDLQQAISEVSARSATTRATTIRAHSMPEHAKTAKGGRQVIRTCSHSDTPSAPSAHHQWDRQDADAPLRTRRLFGFDFIDEDDLDRVADHVLRSRGQ